MATSKSETESSSSLDTVKLIVSVLLLVAGMAGYYYFSAESGLYRALGLLVVVGIAIAVFATTERGAALLGFMKNSRTEVRKMVWPTRQEALQTTLIVLVMVLIVGIFLWLLDTFLGWAVRFVIGGA